MIFLHGISGCWQNWLETLPHLAAPGARSPSTYRVLAPARCHRGSRRFQPTGALSTTSARSSESSERRAHRQLDGRLRRGRGADAAPRRFDRLALVSAAGILNTWEPDRRAAATTVAWNTLGPIFAAHSRQILARPLTRRAVAGPAVRYPERLRGELLWEQMSGGLRCPAFGAALRSLIHHDIRDRLGGIETPTLIAWGFEDRIVPVQAALSFHRRIPGSRLRSSSAPATSPSSSAPPASMRCSISSWPGSTSR